MINLFEYQNKVDIQDSFEGLEGFLDEIWNSREKNSFYSENGNDKIESQRFLQFIHKSNELTRVDCESGINRCLALVDDLIPMSELSQEVFAAAINYNMTAYDMFYAVTARRYNGRLLTIDKKLKEAAKKMKLQV